jgi:hypothetical protein
MFFAALLRLRTSIRSPWSEAQRQPATTHYRPRLNADLMAFLQKGLA